MRVYLGAAIDMSKSDPAVNFTSMASVLDDFVKCDYVVYNPQKAFSVFSNETVDGAKYVVDVNTAALLGSDLAFFVVDDNPSFGVPVEIWMAAEKRIETIVWWKASKKPGLYLQSLVSNRFSICEDEDSLRSAFVEIKNMMGLSVSSTKPRLEISTKLSVLKKGLE